MKQPWKSIMPLFVMAIFILQLASFDGAAIPSTSLQNELVDLGGGRSIEVSPEETLHRFALTDQGLIEWNGISDGLVGQEHGSRDDSFGPISLDYTPLVGTENTSMSVPFGADWEAYELEARVSDITENRTWITNGEFDSSANWTVGTVGAGSGNSTVSTYWESDGHDGDPCMYFEIDSTTSFGGFWRYDQDDRGYARQTMELPRGEVVWAGISFDYQSGTYSGSWTWALSMALYVVIESSNPSDWDWRLVQTDMSVEGAWNSTGLMTIPVSNFNTPTDQNVTVEVGFWSMTSEGFSPDPNPYARVDNFEIYIKTRAKPSDINLQMNGLDVVDDITWGIGTVTQEPVVPWQTSPVSLDFTWWPTPLSPAPSVPIAIELSIDTRLFARRIDIVTAYELSPTSYGQRFTVTNGSTVEYTTYFFANIPSGYLDHYFFNMSLPSDRDVYHVGPPLDLLNNLTTDWIGGNPGDGYLNVSVYQVDPELGKQGAWWIKSAAPNMISDIDLYDYANSQWAQSIDFRAGNSSRIRVYTDPSFEGATVNVTLYDPTGSSWLNLTATVDSLGQATTQRFTLGSNATAGTWVAQAIVSDSDVGGIWYSTGFFKRAFTITHESELILDHPLDAVGSWLTNVTHGDLMLIILRANDTDSDVLVPGGVLTLDWALGTDTFDDNGNGEYTKAIDTSLLPTKGQYVMNLTWTKDSFDTSNATLLVNVNYPSILSSPDYPGITGPIGYDQTIMATYSNTNGTGIDGAAMVCNWSNPYTVTPMGGGDYEFLLDTSGIGPGQYPVMLNASAPFVNPQTLVLYVQVREVYNSISYSANELSIPVGETESFLLTWTNTDTDERILDGESYISCNWTSFHRLGESNYTVSHLGNGVYNITIYTESDDPLTTGNEFYTATFNVMRKDFRNHTFDVKVRVRSHNTLFVLDEPVENTEYGTDIIVLVFYQDADMLEGIVNDTGEVRFAITSPDIGSVKFSVQNSLLGAGHYNTSIPSQQWGSIGWKNFTIQVTWQGVVTKYYSRNIQTRVRITGTETNLFLEVAPTATYYLDLVTFTTTYANINGTKISNTTGHVLLAITPLTSGHPVTQAYFIVAESGTDPGSYKFQLDTSGFQSIGVFDFQLDFMWTSGQSPFYENQSMTVSLVVLSRPTYVDYVPVPATPFYETADFTFSYVDLLSTAKIPSSPQLEISLNEPGVSYSVSYDSGSFTMAIDTDSLAGIGTFVLNLNLTWTGEPFYESISSFPFMVEVIQRTTQLTHDPFEFPQWGNNATIVFNYTDLVAHSTIGMSGTLVLNITVGYYAVQYLGSGQYLVVLNTSAPSFGSDGTFILNATIQHTDPYFADASRFFGFTILKRSTQFGYENPDPTPYLDNVTSVVSYIDDSTGRGISDASVSVTNNVSALILDTNYWVTYLGNGQYRIEVDSVALSAPGVYVLNVTSTYSGAPFYLPQSRNVNARITERTTQIIITQTPGDVPYLENITIGFRFEDFLTGNPVGIDKGDITLTHDVSMTPITSGQYNLYDFGTYYEIVFNSTILSPSSLVNGHQIHLDIGTGPVPPYYGFRSITTFASTTERQTQIFFPLVEDTPYFENLTMELDFVDFLTGNGIEGATLTLSTFNWSVPEYQVIELGAGKYRVLVISTVFGSTGTVYFNVTLSRPGIPFFAERTTANVPATIRLVQTAMVSETPAPGSTGVGVPINVTLTLKDFDHDVPLAGATITTDWFTRYGTSFSIMEVGNGVYMITLNMTGLIAQDYPFTVQADKTFYAPANITVVVTPGAASFEILIHKSTYYALWGELIDVRVDVREDYYHSLVPGANVTMLWNNTVYNFSDLDNGTYSLLLYTSDANFGVHEPQITVSRRYYSDRQTSFTMVVSKAPAQIVSELAVVQVVVDTTTNFTVYLNDTVSNAPVIGASVFMELNNTVYLLFYNGTPGYYEGTIDATGFDFGPYEITLSAASVNHDFLDTVLEISVVPIPTDIGLVGGLTSLSVILGDSLLVRANYNDTYYGGFIAGATINYTVGSFTETLTEEANGTYWALIDVSSLGAQAIQLRIVGTKAGYSTASRTVVLNILAIPTEVTVNTPLRDGYHGDTVQFTFHYNDTHNNLPLPSATVDVLWEGANANVTDLGNGYYFVETALTPISPILYDVDVRFSLHDHATFTLTVSIVIIPTPAQIIAPASVSVPVNDTSEVYINVKNLLTNETVTGLPGSAYWDVYGEQALGIRANGSYILTIPDIYPMQTYRIDLAFSTSIYDLSPVQIEVTIRAIRTELRIDNTTIETAPGAVHTVNVVYYDLDHDEFVSGAEINVMESDDFVYEGYTQEGNTYVITIRIVAERSFNVTITFSKENYESEILTLDVKSDITPGQQLAVALQYAGGFLMVLFAMLIVGYLRIWSIPKLVRQMNRMIRDLSRGKIPKPPTVPDRHSMVVSIIDEEFVGTTVRKVPEEIAVVSIEAIVPDVEELLAHLAAITGLGDKELEAFRQDLARMRASERPGFIREVIEQEEARRAETLAEDEEAKRPEEAKEILEQKPEELEELRVKLRRKGMSEDEVDIIIEQAKGLSKADLEALLDSLGIRL